mmetsp:Transcript_2285/g.6602  ORF Transcript_2285/g.6602 Transcript_2285/m.6602 type:complete len:218 (-) Transcript_2285:596-1249(-)
MILSRYALVCRGTPGRHPPQLAFAFWAAGIWASGRLGLLASHAESRGDGGGEEGRSASCRQPREPPLRSLSRAQKWETVSGRASSRERRSEESGSTNAPESSSSECEARRTADVRGPEARRRAVVGDCAARKLAARLFAPRSRAATLKAVKRQKEVPAIRPAIGPCASQIAGASRHASGRKWTNRVHTMKEKAQTCTSSSTRAMRSLGRRGTSGRVV